MPKTNNIFDSGMEPLEVTKTTVIDGSDIFPRTIKQRHIDGVLLQRGLAANRPDGTTETLFYFATDTGVLSAWTGTAWLTVTLT